MSCIKPTGQNHPQKNLFVSKSNTIRKPRSRKGKEPWMNEKKINSKIPVPAAILSLGVCKNGKIRFSLKIDKSIEKINSNIKKLIKRILINWTSFLAIEINLIFFFSLTIFHNYKII